jgi:hypothetical protein
VPTSLLAGLKARCPKISAFDLEVRSFDPLFFFSFMLCSPLVGHPICGSGLVGGRSERCVWVGLDARMDAGLMSVPYIGWLRVL